MERWALYSQGETLPSLSRTDVQTNLKKIGLKPAQTEALLSGKKVSIRKGMLLDDARKLGHRFKQCGVHCRLQLELNEACLNAGLTPLVSEKNPVKEKASYFYRIPLRAVSGLVFTLSGKNNLESIRGQSPYELSVVSYNWQAAPLILACLVAGATLSSYFVRLLSERTDWRMGASVVGIALLLACVAVLPRLLQPLLSYSLFKRKDRSASQLFEKNVLTLGKRRYGVYKNEYEIAEIERGADSSEMTLLWSTRNYHWNKAYSAANIGDQKVQELQDGLFDVSALGDVLETVGWFQRIRQIFSSGKPMHKQVWDTHSASVILDHERRLSALLYKYPCPAIQIMEGTEPEDREALILFALSLYRSHYV